MIYSILLAVGIALAICLFLFLLSLNIYGMVICFKKKWHFGIMSLLVPWFAIIVGGAKYLFKKDLLK